MLFPLPGWRMALTHRGQFQDPPQGAFPEGAPQDQGGLILGPCGQTVLCTHPTIAPRAYVPNSPGRLGSFKARTGSQYP